MKIPRGPGVGLVIASAALFLGACVGLSRPEGWASPVVDGDTALIFQDKDKLSLVELSDTGIARTVWTFPDEDIPDQKDVDLKAVYRAPESDGDSYVLAGFSGTVVSITPDGQVEWLQERLDGDVVTGAVLADDVVLVGTLHGKLYGLDATNGTISWSLELGDEIWAPPIVRDGVVYVATMGGDLFAINLATQEVLWERDNLTGATPDLALVDDALLFVPSLNSTVRFVDAASGDEVGEPFRAADWVWTSPAVDDGVAYFGDFSGVVYALDITTRQVVWEYDTGDKVKASPVIVGDTLVAVNEDGVVHFIDRANGGRRNAVPVSGIGTVRAGPTVADGLVYIIGTKGRLFRADPATLSVIEMRRPGDD